MSKQIDVLLKRLFLLIGVAAMCVAPAEAVELLDSTFTFQGRVSLDGTDLNDTADFEFGLWDADAAGNMIGTVQAINNVTVLDGLFTVELDFGTTAFNGEPRWVEISLRSPAGAGAFSTLAPRQAVNASPYSLHTRGVYVDNNGFVGIGRDDSITGAEYFGVHAPVGDGAYGGMYMETESATGWPFYGYATAGTGDAWHYLDGVTDQWKLFVNAVRMTVNGSNGNVGIGDDAPDQKLSVNGNVEAQGAGTFTDDPFDLYANAERAMRLEYGTTADGESQNVIGGHANNTAVAGVIGATIGGGGSEGGILGNLPNTVSDRWGTIGGGSNNLVGNNNGDPQDAGWGTVGGGIHNQATGGTSTIGGGFQNTASGGATTVAGGELNQATQNYATIAGGRINTASGSFSTVVGGEDNEAVGGSSFAAGRHAKANHTGAWVWAAGDASDFASTGDNQFLIRAPGGVGIGTNDPATLLEVAGTTTTDRVLLADEGVATAPSIGFLNDTNTGIFEPGGVNANTLGFSTGGLERMRIDSGGDIGVGTTAPVARFEVISTVDHATVDQGNTAHFELSNTNAVGPTVYITANSTNAGQEPLQVVNTGRGGAATFEARDTTNAGFGVAALSRGSGNAVQGDANGTGVGVLGIASNGSTALPLKVTQNGAGSRLAEFESQGVDRIYIESDGDVNVEALSDLENVFHVERITDHSGNNDVMEVEMSTGSTGGQLIECQKGTNVVFAVDHDGDVRADGTYTSPADFAELIHVSTGADTVEPGDVIVIDTENPRAVVKSTTARSTLVSGIYSTKPGFVGSEHDWDEVTAELFPESAGDADLAPVSKTLELARMIDEIPVAVIGIVPCKVSAENGAIQPGDLLVTSNTPGHAMRDDNARAGTIVGKSLGYLDSGTGVIRVLVTLQ